MSMVKVDFWRFVLTSHYTRKPESEKYIGTSTTISVDLTSTLPLCKLSKVSNTEFSTPVEASTESVMKTELQLYMEADLLNCFADPLQRWRRLPLHLPNLARLAKEVLSIPAISVPSEQVFSKAGDLISAKRSRIRFQGRWVKRQTLTNYEWQWRRNYLREVFCQDDQHCHAVRIKACKVKMGKSCYFYQKVVH